MTNPTLTQQRALNTLRELIAELVPAAQSREPSAQYIVRQLRAVEADMVTASAACQAETDRLMEAIADINYYAGHAGLTRFVTLTNKALGLIDD